MNSSKIRFLYLSVIICSVLFLHGCLHSGYSGNGTIDFHPGVHDLNWALLDKVNTQVVYTAIWGDAAIRTPVDYEEMSKYYYLFASDYLNITSASLELGYAPRDIWN